MKVAKIINEESELRLLRDKNKNKKIVLTSGCFDLLHYGHICHLEESKNCGDYLVVAVNSDDSVKRLKGNTKPVVPENQRIKILQALRFVDAVFVFDEDDVLPDVDDVALLLLQAASETAVLAARIPASIFFAFM